MQSPYVGITELGLFYFLRSRAPEIRAFITAREEIIEIARNTSILILWRTEMVYGVVYAIIISPYSLVMEETST